MPVGGFPGLVASRRRTIRAPTNPMDKSTIVSIYPKRIHEKHVTIQPGVFTIEPGSYNKPSILVVGSSSWWKDIDDEQPLLEIPNSSIQVADAIVKGYCNGLIGCNMSTSMPGIFWVPGNFTVKDIDKKLIDKAQANQERWYNAIIKLTDSLWARTNGNPLVVSDDARLAAQELGVSANKNWMKDFTLLAKSNCIACGSPRNPEFPVCPTCHAIVDVAKAKELGIVFAQK